MHEKILFQAKLSDQFDLKTGMIFGARLAGTSFSRTANLVSASRATMSRAMISYTNLDKVSSTKHNSGQISKLKDSDGWVLKKIVARNRKTALSQIQSEIYTSL